MTPKYKVHIGFITSDGVTIRPGEYEGTEFDMAEARRRSYVTSIVPGGAATVPTVKIEEKIPDDILTKINLGQNSGDLPTITLGQTTTLLVAEGFKINYATETEIVNLKYVGKKAAKKVIEAREVKWFDSYSELNKRAPLYGGKIWEDAAFIDFSHPIKQDEAELQVVISDTGSDNSNVTKKYSSK